MLKVQKPFYLILFTTGFLVFFACTYAAEIEHAATESEQNRAASSELETGRTFGQIKKFQAALLPIMYKLGVLSAVIMMTLFLAFKGVLIGTLILVLNVAFFAIKFGAYLKAGHQQSHGWAPAPVIAQGHGWAGSQKDVHLHIHNAHGKPDFGIPYSAISSPTNTGGWDVHSNAVEPTWSGSNPVGYIHHGRQFFEDDLSPYPGIQQIIANDQINGHINAQPKVLDKKTDKQSPTIVTAETASVAKHIVTPYNYVNKQNRKK